MSIEICQNQVTDNVFAFTGTKVNWVIVREGSDLTLIDAGWHGDIQAVERSIRSLGSQPQDVRAVLVTHAHADHTGALNYLFDNYRVPFFMDAVELPNAFGEVSETGGPADVAKRMYRPQVLRWAAQLVKAGGLKHFTFPAAQAFPGEVPIDLPGSPVPVPTPGHTSGHCSYFLPDVGVVVTGDALVTAHPIVRGVGPRLLPPYFSHDQDRAVGALHTLRELDVDMFIPGHGPTWYGPISEAVDRALDRPGADTTND